MTTKLQQLITNAQGASEGAIVSAIALMGLWEECEAIGLVTTDHEYMPLIELTSWGRKVFGAI